MAHDVFISYAVEDVEVAGQVCRALEEQDIRCWIAPRDVPFGGDYEEAIVDAIAASPTLVLVLSAHSNASPHVKREIQTACAEGSPTRIIPFRIDAVAYGKALRYYLGSAQWLDASAPPLEAHLRRLVEHVRTHLPAAGQSPAPVVDEPTGGGVPAGRPEAEEASGGSEITRRPSRAWWVIVGAAALLAVALLLTLLAVSRRGDPERLGALVTPTFEPTPRPPSPTPTPEVRDSPTPTPTATPQPTATPKPTVTPRPTATPRQFHTPTPLPPQNMNVGPGPVPVEMSDLTLERLISHSLKAHGINNASVKVSRGVATLSGVVDKEEEKRIADGICRKHGVKEVINLLAWFPH